LRPAGEVACQVGDDQIEQGRGAGVGPLIRVAFLEGADELGDRVRQGAVQVLLTLVAAAAGERQLNRDNGGEQSLVGGIDASGGCA
jgi:hypothetical protein